jgi:hypothetical protein
MQQGPLPWESSIGGTTATKKTDVADHPEVINHIGLLVNEPLGGAGLLFI